MQNYLITKNIIDAAMKETGVSSIGKASIREIKRIVDYIQLNSEIQFIRMEMGVPGLLSPQFAVEAEIHAIQNGVTSVYPDIDGIPELKNEISRFCKLFIDLNISSKNCFPTVGSMQGGYVSLMVATRRYSENKKSGVLFLDPGFPVHKQMVKMLGIEQISVDIYQHRGQKLRVVLDKTLSEKNIGVLLYSNPNNPSWINFNEDELSIIGEMANKYDLIIIEDLAYIAMDFRKDLSFPGRAPFQSTIAKYCNNFIILISSSKVFSYAGQRIGMMVIAENLFNHNYPALLKYFPSNHFGHSVVYGALYATTAGVAHSTQYGLMAILKNVNNGNYNFVEAVKEYGLRAKIAKNIFKENGFKIVYDKDDQEEIADGFYFTVTYPGLKGDQLVEALLYYGISTLSLARTGSTRLEGIRICVSLVSMEQMPELERRLKAFDLAVLDA